MKLFINTKNGFSLMEIIVVMLLVGVMAAVAGIGYVQVVRGMLFTKMNAATIQKGELAMTRLVKEFNNMSITSVTAADATSITFSFVKVDVVTNLPVPSSRTVEFNRTGSTITYDGVDILADQVSEFGLKYYDNYDTVGQTTWQSSRRSFEISL